MKKMIHAYKEGTEIIIDIKGSGKELLNDFAAICGTLANTIDETVDIPEDRIASTLAMAMAQGISERHDHERKEG